MAHENQNPQTVTRDAQKIQGCLDLIHAMQMRIDSNLNQIKTAQEFKKPLTDDQVKWIHDDLIKMNEQLLNIVHVLVG